MLHHIGTQPSKVGYPDLHTLTEDLGIKSSGVERVQTLNGTELGKPTLEFSQKLSDSSLCFSCYFKICLSSRFTATHYLCHVVLWIIAYTPYLS